MGKKFQIQISENSLEFLFVIPSPEINELVGIDNLENYIICEKKETNISWKVELDSSLKINVHDSRATKIETYLFFGVSLELVVYHPNQVF